MTPDVPSNEDRWLASELKRAADYARKAYDAEDEKTRQLYLANMVGTLDTLYGYYKLLLPPAPTTPVPTRVKKDQSNFARAWKGLWG